MQLQGWILQRSRHRRAVDFHRWTESTEENTLRIAAAQDQAIDKNVVPSLDICPHRKIAEFTGISGAQVVQFYEADTYATIHASNNTGIVTGRQSFHDGRFPVVRWRQASLLDFCFLRVAPIVVGKDASVAVVQFKIRI